MTSNAERGADVEQWVAAKYDVEHAPDETDWYDCIDREHKLLWTEVFDE